MIHEIVERLEVLLLAQGCPAKVVDREAFKRTAWVSNRILIVVDETGDTFGPPTSQSINPKRHFDCNTGVKLTVYGKVTKTGALEFEHKRLVRQAVDLTLVALRQVRAALKIGLAIGGGSFVDIEDLASSEQKGGAAYELTFTFTRGVAGLTWAGAASAEAGGADGSGIAATTNTTEVSIADEDDGDPLTPERV